MSTNQTSRDTWRKFLGIKDPSATLESGRIGGSIGRTAGRSGGGGGGGNLDSDSVPEGEESSGAEKGDGAGDAGKQIKLGDEFDRLEDLYDCETNEEVTLDGLGGGGAGPTYPTGFENCEKQELPEGEFKEGYYWYASQGYVNMNDSSDIMSSSGNFQTYSEAAAILDQNKMLQGSDYWSDIWAQKKASKSNWSELIGRTEVGGEFYTGGVEIYRKNCVTEYNAVCALPPPIPKWPAPDKNHLVWNDEKGCFEPLCPELNNQVLDKYKSCEEERILCDKDGNKVKVTVDGDTVKVTQAKYNQTAEIKNGKVQTVKKLTESQKEAEFK